MRSSSRRRALVAVAVVAFAAWSGPAKAQQQAQGFALERLYLSAPGGGWFVMDTLDMHGGLGGVMALTAGYAHDPLRVRANDGSERLTVVSDEAIATIGVAATYLRWKLYADFAMPLAVGGDSGASGAYTFAAPNVGTPFAPSGVNPRATPDTIADARVGLDVRLVGDPGHAFRLGLGAQLWIATPNEDSSEYLTDGALRAMGRVLFAGDVGRFTYAGQLGVHVRPVDDTPSPGAPQGSELLFGAAAGVRVPVTPGGGTSLVVGPEVFGASAFRSLFGSGATEAEGLLSGRFERTGGSGPHLRLKVGMGAGLDPRFGAPEWRAVFGIEVFDHTLGKIGR